LILSLQIQLRFLWLEFGLVGLNMNPHWSNLVGVFGLVLDNVYRREALLC